MRPSMVLIICCTSSGVSFTLTALPRADDRAGPWRGPSFARWRDARCASRSSSDLHSRVLVHRRGNAHSVGAVLATSRSESLLPAFLRFGLLRRSTGGPDERGLDVGDHLLEQLKLLEGQADTFPRESRVRLAFLVLTNVEPSSVHTLPTAFVILGLHDPH